jgi:hypothetical protein
MTHGRPSMTSHISPVPLPEMGVDSHAADPCELSGQPCDHKMGYMTFYVSTIELYKILESILSEVYNAWQSRSNNTRTTSPRGSKLCSLDVLMELDDRLSAYESNVPKPLNWTKEPLQRSGSGNISIFKRQQNVLRARYSLPMDLSITTSPLLMKTEPYIFASFYIALCSRNCAPMNGQVLRDALMLTPQIESVQHPRRRI